MNTMRRGLNRFVLPAAAAIGLAGAYAAPALAQSEGEAKQDRVMILHTEGGKHGEHGEHGTDGTGAVRQFHVMRLDGAEPSAKCDGDKTEVTDEKDGRKTKFFICTGGRQLTSAERVEKLEKALERIQSDEHMSAEHKERVAGALRDAIGRMRETN